MIPDTAFDPIFEGQICKWGIKDGLFTIQGQILSATKEPQSEKFVGKDSVGNINRKVWHGRYIKYTLEVVVEKTLDDSSLPAEGEQLTIDGLACLADDGAKINWTQDNETKVTIVACFFPHMDLSAQ